MGKSDIFRNLNGKKILVIGLARSGMAGARLLLDYGARVIINELRPEKDLTEEERDFLASYPEITFVGGGHPPGLVTGETAFVLKNPGVPLQLAPVREAEDLRIPVISEVELAAHFLKAPLIAITGTNGKTTTSALTGEIFRAAGRKTFVAGNIGLPLATLVGKDKPDDIVVAEVSSFQLEGTIDFNPRLSAILNITPDHLDRHGSLQSYREAKTKIFANQSAADAVVLNADDPETFALRHLPACRVYLFSRKKEVGRGVFLADGMIVFRDGKKEKEICKYTEIKIPGLHNLENALAAALLACLGGIEPRVIAKTLSSFSGVPHRLELVRTLAGVDYINDSKGTNPAAAIKALEAVNRPVILIAGGYEKGADFSSFAEKVKEKVLHVFLIGQTAGRLADALEGVGYYSYELAPTLEKAVAGAHDRARAGDVVLLSPACASWDMFKDFEERGELFKRLVWALGG